MKRRSFVLPIVFLFLSFSAVTGQIDRTKKPPSQATPKLVLPKIQRGSLANGLKILLVEHHELPVVQFQLVFQSGSSQDPSGKAGVAQLTAQMVDEGTGKRSALEVADDLDVIGASMSVNAIGDATFASLLTIKEHLRAALDVFADILANPSFPETEWDRVKKSHLTSLLQQKDQPGTVATNVFNTLTYGEMHPYGRPAEGTESSVQTIALDDLKSFYQVHYRPNNATLILVGDVTMKEMRPIMEQYFGGWKSGTLMTASAPNAPTITGTQVFLVDKPKAAQSEIRIGHVGVARQGDDFFPLVLLNTILGGQFSSRINMNLRESKGYTYGARSAFSMWKQAGPFVASAAVKTSVTDSSVVEFMKELRRICEEDVTAKELEFAKNSLVRRVPQTFETPQQIATQLVSLVLYDLPDQYFDTYVQNLDRVSIGDVRRVAQKYIHPAASHIVIVGDVAVVKGGLENLGYGNVQVLSSEGKIAH